MFIRTGESWAFGPPKKMKMTRADIKWVGQVSKAWAPHLKSGEGSLFFDRAHRSGETPFPFPHGSFHQEPPR
jgi:hypothetical protein